MFYDQSPEKAAEFAELALSEMENRNIPPQPNNFAVWYLYFTETDPELNRVLNLLIERNIEFTEERNADLYAQFCANQDDMVPYQLMAEQVETELESVLSILDKTDEQAVAYGKSLVTASGELAQEAQSGKLGQIVRRLLQETRAMAEQNRDLENRVRESSEQVKKLREDLENTRKEGFIDGLTELANRKFFDSTLQKAAINSLETGQDLTLLFLDVDHFKKFNDTYGHQVGDQVLKLLAKILKQSIRDRDTAARYGGEEFAVILPNTAADGGMLVADRILNQVANKPLIHRRTGEKLGQVTVSIGLALMRKEEAIRDFIDRADQALYMAKKTGRNRIVTEGQLMRASAEEALVH
ncbi:MAG: GGDEF domain-containing protein [Rhodospirillales bacterium]|nr:GGDEF domain-containing protein [Rhodospirillales bacterium]